MRAYPSRIFLSVGLIVSSILMFGCGAANNGSGPGSTPGSNVQAIAVNGGPGNVIDAAFTSVTVCAPGSSSNCQTISGILVDTGSSGLRILSSALTVSLPAQTNSTGQPIAECAPFASGITWGAVQTADLKISGEQASSVAIQVIGSPNFPNIPMDCTNLGNPMDDLPNLHANGLLGVSSFIHDCGTDCAAGGLGYYACSSGVCTDISQSLSAQVQNPVASFAADNNGVILELPAVTGGVPSASGSLIFGIGTQSNNGLGGATVFDTDPLGHFGTTYNGNVYTQSFLDSGSNGIFYLSSIAAGFAICSAQLPLYCPTSTQSITVTNNAAAGTNGSSAPVTFTVGNATSLLASGNDAAINGLAGPAPALLGSGTFDFGLPFFFGRNVYTAIEGKSTPGGTGPFTAY